MGGDGYDKYRIQVPGAEGKQSLKQRFIARRKPILIAVLALASVAFAAGWNPPSGTVHTFTETSDYNARRESGCTNSGDGCHGDESAYTNFNDYHPDTECNVCHDYTGVGCIPCHGPAQHECTGCHDGSMEGVSDCVRLTDSYPKGHYRESLHEAIGTDMKQAVLAAPGGTAKATCADCHSKDLREAHKGVPEADGSSYGPEIGCGECHNDKKSGALDQVLAKWEDHSCEDCHGEKSQAPMHDTKVAAEADATGAAGCAGTGEGCHANKGLHALHPDAPATCSGAAAPGEPVCHDLELQSAEATTTACGPGDGTCHAPYQNDEYAHKNDASVHLASAQGSVLLTDLASGVSVTCGSCHSMDLDDEHGRGNVSLGDNACTGCHNKNETTVGAVANSWPQRTGVAACAVCHHAKHADIDRVHTATQSGCVKSGCHDTADVRILHKAIGCTNAGCHSNAGSIAGGTMSCGGTSNSACHKGTDLNAIHKTPHGNAAGTKSSACVSCHGATVTTVSPAHDGCSCHTLAAAAPGDVRNAINSGSGQCADCHRGTDGAHGFESENSASGHNTTTYGRRGAYSKFDGSQGPVVLWESEISNPALPPTWTVETGFQDATRPDGITSVTVGQTGAMTTQWPFPTVNVFWQPGDPAAPADAMFLTKDSVITCQDCHSGLTAAGPHGADQNWGLDPDYPADYSKGELTKLIDQYPSGIKLRSDFSRAPTYSSGMTMICSKCHDLQNQATGTALHNPLPLVSTGTDPFVHDGETFTPVLEGTSWRVYTDSAGHPSTAAAGGTRWAVAAAGSINVSAVGSSNTAHGSHHQDNADGSAQCVNCHIGVPHAWKRPRLLVNTGVAARTGIYTAAVKGDVAPYLDPDQLGVARGNLVDDPTYSMPWYNYVDGNWVLTTTTTINTPGARTWNASRGSWTYTNTYGWTKIGMLSLSAVDNHGLWAGSPVAAPYDTGAAYWAEPSCQACNDHAGEDGIRIINFED